VPAEEVATVRLIDREELKARLDRGDDVKLVLALEEWAYRAKHIPGTLFFPTVQAALRELKPDDDIVVYCSNPACSASILAYQGLVARGYRNVRRYAGGLLDWEDAGYPLEGEAVGDLASASSG
jgi:rhodanese-related sulfurtransferase